MKYVGRIKWYGGTTREGRVNKFGFIEDATGNEHYIKEHALQGSLKQPKLKDGLPIVFELVNSKVKRVFALSEVKKEDLLEALNEEYPFSLTDHIISRLIDIMSVDKLMEYVIRQTAVLEKPFLNIASKLSADQKLRYYKELIVWSKEQFLDVVRLIDKYDEEIEKNINSSLEHDWSVGEHYNIEALKAYPALQTVVQLRRSDWKELFDEPQWKPIVLKLVKEHVHKATTHRYWDIPFFNIGVTSDWDCLKPAQWLNCDEALTLLKTNTYEFHRMNILLANERYNEGTPINISEISSYFVNEQNEENKKKLTNTLSLKLLLHPEIYPVVSLDELLKRLQKVEESAIRPIALQLFANIEEDKRRAFVAKLPKSMLAEDVFFHYLSAMEQVNQSFPQLIEQPVATWQRMRDDAKTLLIFRIAHQSVNNVNERATYEPIFLEIGKVEQNRQLSGLLLILMVILSNIQDEGTKQFYFTKMRDRIEEDILQQLRENQIPRVIPILPSCTGRASNSVALCEGRYYKMLPNAAYCPRTRRKCHFHEAYGYSGGARLAAKRNISYTQWTLHELLAAANIVPNMPELEKPTMKDTYVNKLAGWLNRIEELHKRLRCSCCDEPFIVDWGGSRRFNAVYNATMFSCNKQDYTSQHDRNIYISHCRCCELTIDSRESKFKIPNNGKYYVCIHCGGAEERIDYMAGDMCPKCGVYERMEKMYENGKWLKCKRCNHEIKTK